MYHETYEDYIRSILGYPNYGSNNGVINTYQPMAMNERNNSQTQELEACYPEIYKVVYPMINKACSTNTRPITSQLIDELTNEIYVSLENDNEINVTINLNNEVSSTNENRSSTSSVANGNRTASAKVGVTKETKVREDRGEDRQFRNRGLQDLIRILLIRELLGRPGFPGNRPPRPPMGPGRPPFPPPHGGPRPPIMPREIDDFYDLYER